VQLSDEAERKLADERMKEWSKDHEEYAEQQLREVQKRKQEQKEPRSKVAVDPGPKRLRTQCFTGEREDDDELEARRRGEIFDREIQRKLEEEKEISRRAIRAKIDKCVEVLEEADTKEAETARDLRNLMYERYSDEITDEARRIWLGRKEEKRKEQARIEEEKRAAEARIAAQKKVEEINQTKADIVRAKRKIQDAMRDLKDLNKVLEEKSKFQAETDAEIKKVGFPQAKVRNVPQRWGSPESLDEKKSRLLGEVVFVRTRMGDVEKKLAANKKALKEAQEKLKKIEGGV
jgi:hypothetical protein